jgi:hypothetical protein
VAEQVHSTVAKRSSGRDWPDRSALEGVAIMGRARGTLSQSFAKKYFRRQASGIEQG